MLPKLLLTRIFLFIIFALLPLSAHALYTEVGISYSYKKTNFSADDFVSMQSTTGSVSFYIWDKIALELSYTDGLAVRQEKDLTPGSTTLPVRTITQFSKVYGADLILGFTDNKALIQPYIKGGAAYISKKQVIQDEGYPSFEISPPPGVSPSYGAGIKFMVSEAFAIKAGIDVWQTPLDDGTKSDDVAGRVGLSWIF